MKEREAILEEARLQAAEHPSKDARWFAKSVYDYLTVLAQPEQDAIGYVASRPSGKPFNPKRVVCHFFDVPPEPKTKLYATPQPKEPEQEPVAWQVEFLIQGIWSPIGNPQRNKDQAEKLAANPSIPKECQRVIELYTTPPASLQNEAPQRKQLTDERIDAIWFEDLTLDHIERIHKVLAAHGIKE